MAFVIAQTRTFDWPVTVRLPDPERPGEIAEQSFIASFEAVPVDEVERIEKEASASGGASGLVAGQAAVIRRVLKGWRDVVDAAGNDVRFNEAMLDAVCAESWFRLAVIGAYAAAMRGDAARRKN